MGLFKKMCLTIGIILLFLSIFKDLTVGTNVEHTTTIDSNSSENVVESEQVEEEINDVDKENITEEHPTTRYAVKSYKVRPGETVISIVETFNTDHNSSIKMEVIIADFEKLNPGVNPHEIQPNTNYLFPIYKN
ncbi:LysM peptidoglycan-binding domain-containing protein [Aquibacillus koreensis]|uniref:LysM peptidoglycan-binding domain-containing protein n=1 Tax=Aquibacillus koreensis TaxID=279446 RepID=A0A9X3WFS0_9BACI|nr:LysM domain-containing protein [Aquibacillus koreensis]MCT2537576.1 LysM peptidoglycan-binding domain-containing protein [Aquibacillus koreensis]MDC3419022.1 LysM peptidoglycan-binding domain-containing protein [Aquibacillus koreensis]